MPSLAWISTLVALGLLALAMGSALLQRQMDPSRCLPWCIAILIVAYELAVALTVGGSVWYLVRQIRHLREVPA